MVALRKSLLLRTSGLFFFPGVALGARQPCAIAVDHNRCARLLGDLLRSVITVQLWTVESSASVVGVQVKAGKPLFPFDAGFPDVIQPVATPISAGGVHVLRGFHA